MKPKYMHYWNKLPKIVEHGEEALCTLCHKNVKNIEAHIKSKHKSQKQL